MYGDSLHDGSGRSSHRCGSSTWLRAAPLAGSLALLALCGCDGPASALDPAGRGAETIARLWWWMAAGAALVWIGVVATAMYALREDRPAVDERHARRLIVWAGAVAPTALLAPLLGWGLSTLPDLLATEAPADGLVIEVTGEEWWWRVRYRTPDGDTVALANEIRLPVGRPTHFRLASADVVHSFWIPALGGKMDMIPGRDTRLTLEATRTGLFRGACAEYCGTAHALMAFPVVVMEEDEFQAWLEGQLAPSPEPVDATARRGRDAFLEHGCGACHTIRGTPADGVVGPDLTHVGGRLTLAAGSLTNDAEAFERWLAGTRAVKPGAHMPPFAMLPDGDLRALARYLDGLE